MKKNIYTVPEGFFEDFEHRVQRRTTRIRRRFIAALFLSPLLLLGAGTYWGLSSLSQEKSGSYAQGLSSDSCDIFLELFED